MGMAKLTTQEAAERLGISRQAVQRAISRKRLRAEKIGRDWFISAAEVEKYREKYLRRPGRK